jgi:hypothetical protein
MSEHVRPATAADVPEMVRISEIARTEREKYQPVFWRKAANANAAQAPYFEHLLTRDNIVALLHETNGHTDGFVIAALVSAPPVYDPGGLTCLIDDFCVERPELWQTAGLTLLKAAWMTACQRGAVQVSVVTPHMDDAKREMLAVAGLSIASEWWVGSL